MRNIFKYVAAVTLNHKENGKNSQRISKTKPFIDIYNWGEIHYPSQVPDCKIYEENNPTSALNVFYHKNKKRQLKNCA